jgi:uncharacterized protein YjbI with pentapeptide repeats
MNPLNPPASASFMERVGWWVSFQPIDLLLCAPGAWGCRFLTVSHRIIAAKVWDATTFVALRAGANLDAEHRASFEVASLRERSLRFADLTASELFAGDLTGADLRQARLSSAQLQGASLDGANLTGASLGSANLTGAHLSHANLTGAYMVNAHLTGASLFLANLTGANLSSVDLAKLMTDLTGADLTGADLTGADLTGGTNLSGANLSSADLSGTKLGGANLSGAYLHALNLTQSQLDDACGDTDTKLPLGLTLHRECPAKSAELTPIKIKQTDPQSIVAKPPRRGKSDHRKK